MTAFFEFLHNYFTCVLQLLDNIENKMKDTVVEVKIHVDVVSSMHIHVHVYIVYCMYMYMYMYCIYAHYTHTHTHTHNFMSHRALFLGCLKERWRYETFTRTFPSHTLVACTTFDPPGWEGQRSK